MILAIARKEFRDLWRDGRFRLGAGAMALLLLVAGLLGGQQLERTRAERAAAAALERQNWVEQGEKDAHSAGHFGIHAFKPAAPLAAFDRGIEPFVGTTVFLEAHRQNQAAFLPAQDATAARRFGELTGASGLQLLVPLLIVLFAFGTLAGERERGTLRQVLSLGVSPRALVLGKALGLGAALAALLAPLALVGLILVARAEGSAAAGLLPRALWLALVYSLYFATFLFGSVAVSSLASSARGALAVLLALWAANGVLAPRLASDLVSRMIPTPALADFERALGADLQQGLDGHDPRDKRLEELLRQTLAEHGATRPDELPFNFQGLAMLESERMANEVFDVHYGRLWDRLEVQDRAVALAGLAAPLLGLRSASMALAGTDFAHHRRFAAAAEEHRRLVVRLLNEDLKYRSRLGDHGYRAGRELWESLPELELAPAPPSEALHLALSGLVVQLLWTAFAFGLLLFSAQRISSLAV